MGNKVPNYFLLLLKSLYVCACASVGAFVHQCVGVRLKVKRDLELSHKYYEVCYFHFFPMKGLATSELNDLCNGLFFWIFLICLGHTGATC